MNLLGAALYDPAAAVSKATSALLAMTAFDTANLRLAITVPAHGKVRFRLRCAIVGATTPPVILLGVLNGATVVGRVQPIYQPVTAPAATQVFVADAEFTATGLAAGAMNVDAAYAVQVIVASTNVKYGGPNTNAGANAWGAFVFEAWDPQPLTAALDGAVNVKQWNGTNVAAPATAGIPEVNVKNVANTAQTARDLGAQLDAAVSSRMATYAQPAGFLAATFPAGTVASTTNITGGTITTTTNLTNAPTAGDFTAAMKTSLNAATPASVTGAVGSVTARVTANVDQVDGAALTAHAAGKLPADVLTVAGTAQTARDLGGQLDATVSSRMATYAQPAGFLGATFPAGTVASTTNITGGTITTTTNLTNAPTAGDFTAAMKASLNAATPASVIGAVGSVTAAVSVTGDLSATMKASVTAAVPSAAANRAEMDANSVGLAAIFARTDVATSSRLAAADYSAPDNAGIAAVKAKTDSLNFTVAGKLDVNVVYFNGVRVIGTGADGDLWRAVGT